MNVFRFRFMLKEKNMRYQEFLGGATAVCLAVAGLAPAVRAADEQWPRPEEIKVPALHKIQEIKPERFELKNGMVVYFLEDHDFPVVDARALIRAGGIYDPPGKVGLATITGEVLRTGGSTRTDGDTLDEMLESMGASVEVNIGDTDGRATVSTLAEDLDKGMGILGEILRTPAFPQDKIDLAKKQERTSIASRNDEHLGIAFRELAALIYGKDHPYGRHTEYATIDAITRDDLVTFHKTYFHPDRIIMTVYGDFDTGKVKKTLNKVFGDWPRSTQPLPPDPEVKPSALTGNFLANKANLTNSIVVLGQEGMRMDNPDYPAMQVFHEALGGGFGGRLMNEIRSKRGLAYATGSFSGAQLHHPGTQLFYVMTQSDSTVVTLGYLKDEIARALADGFTEDEIRRAKDSILNSLVFSLSSKGSVLNRMAAYEFYGYPTDFLAKYQEAVAAVTPEAALAAAKRNLRYPDMATLIVGEKKNFEGDLASLGKITDIDISIPEPAGEEIPEATAADLDKGQKLLAAAAEASGADAMAKLKDMTLEESGVFSVQGMELQISSKTVRQFPDCERSEMKLPMGTMIQSICGETAWMDMMRGAQEMPADVRDRAKAEQIRDLVHVLTAYPELKLQALAQPAEIDGRPADVVYVRNDAVEGWKVYLDQETHRIVAMDYRDQGMNGAPVMARMVMSDYKDVGRGIAWPHTRKILHDGEPFATLTLDSIQLDPGVDGSVFQMPE